MSIGVRIIDDHGTDTGAKVDHEGAVHIVAHTHPPIDEVTTSLPFRQYLTDNGTSTGSNDMIVDGSTNPVDFYISASDEFDIWIKSISVQIGDAGSPTLDKFGALTALTTGVQWCYFTQNDGLYQLHDGIKTNLEFIRIGVDTAGIGTGTDAFLADNSGGGSEKSYLPVIDMSETFGMPYGLRLRKGTTDRIIFTINDALAGLITFNAIGYGIRI
jgi:hypothetical protein